MGNWAENETKTSEINDKRLIRRLSQLLQRLGDKPTESIPATCHGWSETLAAYRFFDNEKVEFEQILKGHRDATVERIGQQRTVLVAQDTTFVNTGVETPVGVGSLREKQREEYLLHPSVAITPQRDNLGVLGASIWQRPEETVAHLRKSKPIEDKESLRWLEGYQLACDVQRQCPDTLIVSVADREGDIREWFADAEQRPLDEKAEYIIRAKSNRRTTQAEGYSYLWEELDSSRSLGSLSIDTPRSGRKPSRRATLSLHAKAVEFCGPARQPITPVTVYAVYAKERHPPKGEAAIEWMLLSSLVVEDYAAAQTIVGWYCCRWEIELYFRVLKQGCEIEKLRLETDQRLSNCIAVYMIVSWRIHTLTMKSRSHPQISCEVAFEPIEWQTLYLMHKKVKPPRQAPSLREATRRLAQLGGFLARKHDGEPGIKTIWRGYRSLKDYVDAIQMARQLL